MKLTKFMAAMSTLCFLGGAASATELSSVGKYTFDWLKSPGKQHCVKVDNKLATRLSSKKFRCKQNEGKTEAGETILACTRVSGGVEYLMFDSLISCENERKAQDANSED